MSDHPIIMAQWDGEHFVPLPRFAKRCDEYYVIGQIYEVEARLQRSQASHRHFFACINEAWKNLPEHLADAYPSAEHLRKHAMIRAGYHNDRWQRFRSEAAAEYVSTFIKPIDEFQIVDVDGSVVHVYSAKSIRDMDSKQFQEMKTKVLDWIADLIGVKQEDLARNTA